MRSWGEGGSLGPRFVRNRARDGFSDSEVGAHALDAAPSPAPSLVWWLRRLRDRIGELRRCRAHLTIDDGVANGAAGRGWMTIDGALVARQIGLRQIGRIHHDEMFAAVDLHDADGRERVAVGTTQIDVDEDHLTVRLVDQQIAHGAELAAADGANLPAADVGLTGRDGP